MIRIGMPVRTLNGRYVVNMDYVEALAKAKAEAVVILPNTDLEALMPTLQGVLIPGGGDVDPNLYGEKDIHCGGIDASTDALDKAVILAAMKQDKEILGICRGQQILNVTLGGSLIQDLSHELKTPIDHSYSEIHHAKTKGHRISVTPNSRLSSILPESIEVNSYHHQAIKKLADGLSVSAVSEDGVIEAIEGKRILAVQWHPERMIEDHLFQAIFDEFVQRCAL